MKFWVIDWSENLWLGSRFARIPLTGAAADLVIEDVEIRVDDVSVTLQQLELEDVEIATETGNISLLSRLYIENVEIRIDNIEASITPTSYGERLAADGMDRRAVA